MEGQESSSCPVHETGCLCCPNLVVRPQRMPRGLRVCSLCWDPEEVDSNSREEMPQFQTDELPRESEAENKASFFLVLLCGLSPEGVAQI